MVYVIEKFVSLFYKCLVGWIAAGGLLHDLSVSMLLFHHVWPQSHGLRWQFLPSGCEMVKGVKKRKGRAVC